MARPGVPTLVIGAGGLVGGAIADSATDVMIAERLPWSDHEALPGAFRDVLGAFAARAATARGWVIHWAAGAGNVASGAALHEQEIGALGVFLAALTRDGLDGHGCIVLASSAGAVYAGCEDGPFSEATTPVPTSPYGHSKVVQEDMVADAANRLGVSAVIARIANVYGPRQDVGKPQGLVSHLCRAAVTGRPINLYVPLDTRRHYIYAADAGEVLVRCGLRAIDEGATGTIVKIVSAGPPVTVGRLVHVVRGVARTPLRVSYGTDVAGLLQPRDVRLRSTVWNDIDDEAMSTDLLSGTKRVFDGMMMAIAGVTRGP